MKTIEVKREDLKKRDDLGRDVYEWGGYHGEANILLPGCNIVLSPSRRLDTGGGHLDTGGGNLDTRGGDLYTRGGHLDTGGGNLYTGGGNLDTGGGGLICGVLYWKLMCMPAVPREKLHVGKVRPVECCRAYWSERLGIKLEGCYRKIEAEMADKLPELLARTDWTPTERWILESHLNGDSAVNYEFD